MKRSPVHLLSVMLALLLALVNVGLSPSASAVQPAWGLGSRAVAEGTQQREVVPAIVNQIKIWALQPGLEASAGQSPAKASSPTPNHYLTGYSDLLGSRWAIQVAAGYQHTCALTMSGGVKCWGDNAYGQLGDGTTQGRLIPVDVVGLRSGVQTIAAGSYHSCALTTSGGVKCWGRNDRGQLGDGTTQGRLTPVDVVGLSSGVRAIAAGLYHTCAVTTAGGVKCWGLNNGGQLGDGTGTQRLTPADVVDLTGGVRTVTAGYFHTCALTETGGAKCWGYNNYGTLGDGTTTTRLTPVDVAGLASGVQAIRAGSIHTCAVTASGGARCWGYNAHGQLGIGNYTTQVVPVDVVGLQGGVTAIGAGDDHTCAALTAGGVKCWGDNTGGQLGDGTTAQHPTPVDVADLNSGVTVVSAGSWHTCAVTRAGGVKCWGANYSGQLGDGTTTRRLTPVDVPVLVFDCGGVTEISQNECAALVALFDSTRGVLWKDRGDWLQTPTPCSWYGVTCTADPIRRGAACAAQGPPCPASHAVSELRLAGNGLHGKLPPELGDLTALQALDLSSNALTGALPPEVGNLAALRTLDLSHTGLGGAIPAELGNLRDLRELRLDHTRFSRIPPELGDLGALAYLDLSSAGLAGATIPPELGKLAALQHLDLSGNGLSGAIPPELGHLVVLRELDLHDNQLSGPLPPELGNLRTLQRLDMTTNSLSGPLPPAWGHLRTLQILNLSANQLSGPLPAEWGELSALQGLGLDTNQLSGPLPPEWGHLPVLWWLDMRNNRLSGPLPPAWGNLRTLKGLYLSNNQLSGPLPPELGKLTALLGLYLDHNHLSGPLPAELGNLTAVLNLFLNNNHLSGSIPPELGNLGSLSGSGVAAEPEEIVPALPGHPEPAPFGTALGIARPYIPREFLDLSCNRLSGPVPDEMWRVSYTHVLDLSGNQLSGSIGHNWWWEPYTQYNMFTDDFYWPTTQTIPPTNLQATVDGSTVSLTWTPIPYTGDGGFYEVSYAAAADGPFTVHGHTADKTAGSYTVTGLPPGMAYYLRVRTFTPAHSFSRLGEWQWPHDYYQQNDLWSDYTAVVSAGGPTPTPTSTPTATATPRAIETPTASVTPPPTRPRWWLPLIWK